MEVISTMDYILFPFYLAGFLILISLLWKKFNPDKSTRKTFLISLFLKLIGGLIFALIYQYYYGYGDTLGYFDEARILHNYIIQNPSNIKYLFSSVDEYRKLFDPSINHVIIQYYNDNTLFVVRTATIFTFFSGNTFLTTTLFFSIFSFSGVWAIYLSFISIAPGLKRQFAWGILFLPSFIFWTSGLSKDSLCIGALGWLFSSMFNLIIHKKPKISNFVVIIFSSFILLTLKSYILYSFLAAICLCAIYYLFVKIRPIKLRVGVIIIMILLLGIVSSTNNYISQAASNISSDMIVEQISNVQSIYEDPSMEGSSYALGTIDPSFTGLLSKTVEAITNVLYRPFLWETTKFVMFMSAAENMILLLLSVYVILKVGIIRLLRIFNEKTIVQFCIFFTVVLAIVVGLSTFNFGTLVRYRTPILPFYTSFLILLNYFAIKPKQPGPLLNVAY